ncbi:hypothetical protein BIW11_07192, partial [Tropilaelaps mercedesae]
MISTSILASIRHYRFLVLDYNGAKRLPGWLLVLFIETTSRIANRIRKLRHPKKGHTAMTKREQAQTSADVATVSIDALQPMQTTDWQKGDRRPKTIRIKA